MLQWEMCWRRHLRRRGNVVRTRDSAVANGRHIGKAGWPDPGGGWSGVTWRFFEALVENSVGAFVGSFVGAFVKDIVSKVVGAFVEALADAQVSQRGSGVCGGVQGGGWLKRPSVRETRSSIKLSLYSQAPWFKVRSKFGMMARSPPHGPASGKSE